MEVLPEVVGVKLTARQLFVPLAAHEPRAAQAEEDFLVLTAVVFDHLLHPADQLFLVVQPEEVIAQVIAERADIVGGAGEEISSSHTPARDQIESAPHQIRVAVEKRHQLFFFAGTQRRAMTPVQIGDLLRREVGYLDHLADIEGRLVEVLDQLVRFGRSDQHQIELLPRGFDRAAVVPAPEHAEKVRAEVGLKNAFDLVHRQHERAAEFSSTLLSRSSSSLSHEQNWRKKTSAFASPFLSKSWKSRKATRLPAVAAASIVRTSSELLPIWRGPLMVMVTPCRPMASSATASLARRT